MKRLFSVKKGLLIATILVISAMALPVSAGNFSIQIGVGTPYYYGFSYGHHYRDYRPDIYIDYYGYQPYRYYSHPGYRYHNWNRDNRHYSKKYHHGDRYERHHDYRR